MTAEATLAWLKQFECEDVEHPNATHIVERTYYTVPTRQLGTFHAKIQSLLGLHRRTSVREVIPTTTPAFFLFTAPAGEGVVSDEAVALMAQTGLHAVMAVSAPQQRDEVRLPSQEGMGAESGSGVLTKVCVAFRSPVYTDESGVEVEAFMLLYPRLLVSTKAAGSGGGGDDSVLTVATRRFIDDFAAVAATSPGLVSWDVKEVIRTERRTAAFVCGSSSKTGMPRTFYKVYDERGMEVDLEEVFTLKERGLPESYLYSLGRLAKRIEQVGELSPELKKVEELLEMLSGKRVECPSDLNAVAQILYSSSKGSADGELMLEEWVGSAERAHELWCSVAVQKPRYTTMTLRYMVSMDSPVAFGNMVRAEIRPHIWESTGPHGCDLDVAKVAYAMYGHRFAYCEVEDKWFAYDGTHWSDKGELMLRQLLRGEVRNAYKAVYDQLSARAGQGEGENRGVKERCKAIGNWVKSLGTRAPKKAIMSEAADLFTVEGLYENLDGPISYRTFAYVDCVFNMVPDSPEQSHYSDGRPEDYCKRSSPIAMRDNRYTMDHPEVKVVLDYFRQVLATYDDNDVPDESVMWYEIDSIAVCKEGGNRLKRVLVNEGPLANNSKSSAESVIHDGFGGYSAAVPTAKMVGGKRGDGDGPTPALRHVQGARIVWGHETSRHDRLNAGQLLELSSGLDPIPLRDPHSRKTVEVIPSYKIFITCNNSPTFDTSEAGLTDRIRLILWLTQFVPVEKAPTDAREQRRLRKYPIDRNFDKKRAVMVRPLQWLLDERYKVVGRYGPREPKAVLEAVEKYRRDNDTFLRFLEDTVEEADGNVDIDTLYTAFVSWHKAHYPKNGQASQYDLEGYMTKKYGPSRLGGTWEGLRQRPKVQRVVAAY
jgi:hypothetical protein